jgi:hypothetical protein
MPATSYTPLQSSKSRVFIMEGRARGDHVPSYESCLRVTGVSRNYGDVESVECPDPSNYGAFIEVAQIKGATERATTTLEGRYALELRSTLLRLANEGCSVDVQLHLGECTDPSAFNTFKKSLVLENVLLTTFGTDDLGALESGDNAVVNETADISAEGLYEILPLAFASQAGTIITNELVDVVICDSKQCGECEVESDGCQRIYALSIAAGGSPSTPADIVFTINGGGAWYAHDIDTLGVAENPDALDCVGDYLVVVSNDSASLHYALKSEFNSYTDPAFTEETTGFVAGGEPNDIFSTGRHAFIVGDGGYIYETSDPTSGVTALDTGSASNTDDLLCVYARSSQSAIAGGKNGAIVYTENGTNWTGATRPVGVGVNINTCWMKSASEWWVGTSGGELWYTLDKGVTWTPKGFSGSSAGTVTDIVFATDSVGYASHYTASNVGRLLRTYDGGYSWNLMPESGTLPANDRINALAFCGDANIVVGAGLADDASDGYLVLGTASGG